MSLLIRWILINFVLLWVIVSPAYSLSEARLLGLSTTGQTALFNLGRHDELKEGDYGVVVKQIRDLGTRDLRIIPIAKAKNIKLNSDTSIWILFKVYDQKKLIKGEAFMIISETEMLSGRKDPLIGRTSIVSNGDSAETVNRSLSNEKDRLAKLKEKYPEVTSLRSPEVRSSKDVDLIDVDRWKTFGRDKYRTALYKSPHQEDFRRELNLATFEKLVTAYLKKVNDPLFSYEDFYDEQKKQAFANEFRERSNFSTEYESFVSTQANKTRENAKLYRSILEKGDSWSEDFSDEEIRNILGEISILQERDRRALVLAEPNPYSFYFNYGFNLNDQQTERDVNYRRTSRYSVDLDFEAVPFVKHETLERFSINASVRTNKTAADANNTNANIDEVSATAGVNWYPLYAPYAIEAPLVFIGTFIRSGTAVVEAPSNNEKATYTVLSMPGIRGGFRYNFRSNFGLRIGLSVETLKLDRVKQSKIGGVLEDQMNVAEGKMNFALAYSF